MAIEVRGLQNRHREVDLYLQRLQEENQKEKEEINKIFIKYSPYKPISLEELQPKKRKFSNQRRARHDEWPQKHPEQHGGVLVSYVENPAKPSEKRRPLYQTPKKKEPEPIKKIQPKPPRPKKKRPTQKSFKVKACPPSSSASTKSAKDDRSLTSVSLTSSGQAKIPATPTWIDPSILKIPRTKENLWRRSRDVSCQTEKGPCFMLLMPDPEAETKNSWEFLDELENSDISNLSSLEQSERSSDSEVLPQMEIKPSIKEFIRDIIMASLAKAEEEQEEADWLDDRESVGVQTDIVWGRTTNEDHSKPTDTAPRELSSTLQPEPPFEVCSEVTAEIKEQGDMATRENLEAPEEVTTPDKVTAPQEASEEATAQEASEEATAQEASEEATAQEASEEATAQEASEEATAQEEEDAHNKSKEEMERLWKLHCDFHDKDNKKPFSCIYCRKLTDWPRLCVYCREWIAKEQMPEIPGIDIPTASWNLQDIKAEEPTSDMTPTDLKNQDLSREHEDRKAEEPTSDLAPTDKDKDLIREYEDRKAEEPTSDLAPTDLKDKDLIREYEDRKAEESTLSGQKSSRGYKKQTGDQTRYDMGPTDLKDMKMESEHENKPPCHLRGKEYDKYFEVEGDDDGFRIVCSTCMSRLQEQIPDQPIARQPSEREMETLHTRTDFQDNVATEQKRAEMEKQSIPRETEEQTAEITHDKVTEEVVIKELAEEALEEPLKALLEQLPAKEVQAEEEHPVEEPLKPQHEELPANELQPKEDPLKPQYEELPTNELQPKEELLKPQYEELQSKEESLKPQHEELQSKEELLKPQYEELQPKEESLKPQYEELQSKEESLKPQHEELQSKEELLKPQYEELQPKEESLKPQYEELQSKAQLLKPQYEELQSKEESLKPQYEELQSKEESLKPQYEELQSKAELLKPRHEELQSKEESLKPQYEELQSKEESLKPQYEELQSKEELLKPRHEELPTEEVQSEENVIKLYPKEASSEMESENDLTETKSKELLKKVPEETETSKPTKRKPELLCGCFPICISSPKDEEILKKIKPKEQPSKPQAKEALTELAQFEKISGDVMPEDLTIKKQSGEALEEQLKPQLEKLQAKYLRSEEEPFKLQLEELPVEELQHEEEPLKLQLEELPVEELQHEEEPLKLQLEELPAEILQRDEEPLKLQIEELSAEKVQHEEEPLKLQIEELPAEELQHEKEPLKLQLEELPAEKLQRDEEPLKLQIEELSAEKVQHEEEPLKLQIEELPAEELQHEKEPLKLQLEELPAEKLQRDEEPFKLQIEELSAEKLHEEKPLKLQLEELPAEELHEEEPLKLQLEELPAEELHEEEPLKLQLEELLAEETQTEEEYLKLPLEVLPAEELHKEEPLKLQLEELLAEKVQHEEEPLKLQIEELPAEELQHEKEPLKLQLEELPAEKLQRDEEPFKLQIEELSAEKLHEEAPLKLQLEELPAEELHEEEPLKLQLEELPAEELHEEEPLKLQLEVLPAEELHEEEPLKLQLEELPAEELHEEEPLKLQLEELPAEELHKEEPLKLQLEELLAEETQTEEEYLKLQLEVLPAEELHEEEPLKLQLEELPAEELHKEEPLKLQLEELLAKETQTEEEYLKLQLEVLPAEELHKEEPLKLQLEELPAEKLHEEEPLKLQLEELPAEELHEEEPLKLQLEELPAEKLQRDEEPFKLQIEKIPAEELQSEEKFLKLQLNELESEVLRQGQEALLKSQPKKTPLETEPEKALTETKSEEMLTKVPSETETSKPTKRKPELLCGCFPICTSPRDLNVKKQIEEAPKEISPEEKPSKPPANEALTEEIQPYKMSKEVISEEVLIKEQTEKPLDEPIKPQLEELPAEKLQYGEGFLKQQPNEAGLETEDLAVTKKTPVEPFHDEIISEPKGKPSVISETKMFFEKRIQTGISMDNVDSLAYREGVFDKDEQIRDFPGTVDSVKKIKADISGEDVSQKEYNIEEFDYRPTSVEKSVIHTFLQKDILETMSVETGDTLIYSKKEMKTEVPAEEVGEQVYKKEKVDHASVEDSPADADLMECISKKKKFMVSPVAVDSEKDLEELQAKKAQADEEPLKPQPKEAGLEIEEQAIAKKTPAEPFKEEIISESKDKPSVLSDTKAVSEKRIQTGISMDNVDSLAYLEGLFDKDEQIRDFPGIVDSVKEIKADISGEDVSQKEYNTEEFDYTSVEKSVIHTFFQKDIVETMSVETGDTLIYSKKEMKTEVPAEEVGEQVYKKEKVDHASVEDSPADADLMECISKKKKFMVSPVAVDSEKGLEELQAKKAQADEEPLKPQPKETGLEIEEQAIAKKTPAEPFKEEIISESKDKPSVLSDTKAVSEKRIQTGISMDNVDSLVYREDVFDKFPVGESLVGPVLTEDISKDEQIRDSSVTIDSVKEMKADVPDKDLSQKEYNIETFEHASVEESPIYTFFPNDILETKCLANGDTLIYSEKKMKIGVPSDEICPDVYHKELDSTSVEKSPIGPVLEEDISKSKKYGDSSASVDSEMEMKTSDEIGKQIYNKEDLGHATVEESPIHTFFPKDILESKGIEIDHSLITTYSVEESPVGTDLAENIFMDKKFGDAETTIYSEKIMKTDFTPSEICEQVYNKEDLDHATVEESPIHTFFPKDILESKGLEIDHSLITTYSVEESPVGTDLAEDISMDKKFGDADTTIYSEKIMKTDFTPSEICEQVYNKEELGHATVEESPTHTFFPKDILESKGLEIDHSLITTYSVEKSPAGTDLAEDISKDKKLEDITVTKDSEKIMKTDFPVEEVGEQVYNKEEIDQGSVEEYQVGTDLVEFISKQKTLRDSTVAIDYEQTKKAESNEELLKPQLKEALLETEAPLKPQLEELPAEKLESSNEFLKSQAKEAGLETEEQTIAKKTAVEPLHEEIISESKDKPSVLSDTKAFSEKRIQTGISMDIVDSSAYTKHLFDKYQFEESTVSLFLTEGIFKDEQIRYSPTPDAETTIDSEKIMKTDFTPTQICEQVYNKEELGHATVEESPIHTFFPKDILESKGLEIDHSLITTYSVEKSPAETDLAEDISKDKKLEDITVTKDSEKIMKTDFPVEEVGEQVYNKEEIDQGSVEEYQVGTDLVEFISKQKTTVAVDYEQAKKAQSNEELLKPQLKEALLETEAPLKPQLEELPAEKLESSNEFLKSQAKEAGLETEEQTIAKKTAVEPLHEEIISESKDKPSVLSDTKAFSEKRIQTGISMDIVDSSAYKKHLFDKYQLEESPVSLFLTEGISNDEQIRYSPVTGEDISQKIYNIKELDHVSVEESPIYTCFTKDILETVSLEAGDTLIYSEKEMKIDVPGDETYQKAYYKEDLDHASVDESPIGQVLVEDISKDKKYGDSAVTVESENEMKTGDEIGKQIYSKEELDHATVEESPTHTFFPKDVLETKDLETDDSLITIYSFLAEGSSKDEKMLKSLVGDSKDYLAAVKKQGETMQSVTTQTEDQTVAQKKPSVFSETKTFSEKILQTGISMDNIGPVLTEDKSTEEQLRDTTIPGENISQKEYTIEELDHASVEESPIYTFFPNILETVSLETGDTLIYSNKEMKIEVPCEVYYKKELDHVSVEESPMYTFFPTVSLDTMSLETGDTLIYSEKEMTIEVPSEQISQEIYNKEQFDQASIEESPIYTFVRRDVLETMSLEAGDSLLYSGKEAQSDNDMDFFESKEVQIGDSLITIYSEKEIQTQLSFDDMNKESYQAPLDGNRAILGSASSQTTDSLVTLYSAKEVQADISDTSGISLDELLQREFSENSASSDNRQNNGYDKQNNGYDKQNNGYDKQNNGYDKENNGYDKEDNESNKQNSGYDSTHDQKFLVDPVFMQGAAPSVKSSEGAEMDKPINVCSEALELRQTAPHPEGTCRCCPLRMCICASSSEVVPTNTQIEQAPSDLKAKEPATNAQDQGTHANVEHLEESIPEEKLRKVSSESQIYRRTERKPEILFRLPPLLCTCVLSSEEIPPKSHSETQAREFTSSCCCPIHQLGCVLSSEEIPVEKEDKEMTRERIYAEDSFWSLTEKSSTLRMHTAETETKYEVPIYIISENVLTKPQYEEVPTYITREEKLTKTEDEELQHEESKTQTEKASTEIIPEEVLVKPNDQEVPREEIPEEKPVKAQDQEEETPKEVQSEAGYTKANAEEAPIELEPGEVVTIKQAEEAPIELEPGEVLTKKQAEEAPIQLEPGEVLTKKQAEEAPIELEPGEVVTKTKAEEAPIELEPGEVLTKKQAEEAPIELEPGEVVTKTKAEDSSLENKTEEAHTKAQDEEAPIAIEPEEVPVKMISEEIPKTERLTRVPSEIQTRKSTERKPEVTCGCCPLRTGDHISSFDYIAAKKQAEEAPKEIESGEVLTETQAEEAPKEIESGEILTETQAEEARVEIGPEEVLTKIQAEKAPIEIEPKEVHIKAQAEETPIETESKEVPTKIEDERAFVEIESEEVPTNAQAEEASVEIEPEEVPTKMYSEEILKKEGFTRVPSEIRPCKRAERKPEVTCGCCPLRTGDKASSSEYISAKRQVEEESKEIEPPKEASTEVPTDKVYRDIMPEEVLIKEQAEEVLIKEQAEKVLIKEQAEEILLKEQAKEALEEPLKPKPEKLKDEVQSEEESLQPQLKEVPLETEPSKVTTETKSEEKLTKVPSETEASKLTKREPEVVCGCLPICTSSPAETSSKKQFDEVQIYVMPEQISSKTQADTTSVQEIPEDVPSKKQVEEEPTEEISRKLAEKTTIGAVSIDMLSKSLDELLEESFAELQAEMLPGKTHFKEVPTEEIPKTLPAEIVIAAEEIPENAPTKSQPEDQPLETEPDNFETKSQPEDLPLETEPDNFETKSQPEDLPLETEPDNFETKSQPEDLPLETEPDNFETKSQPEDQPLETEPDNFETKSQPEDLPLETEPDNFETKSQPEDLPLETEPENFETKSQPEEMLKRKPSILETYRPQRSKPEIICGCCPTRTSSRKEAPSKTQAEEEPTEIMPEEVPSTIQAEETPTEMLPQEAFTEAISEDVPSKIQVKEEPAEEIPEKLSEKGTLPGHSLLIAPEEQLEESTAEWEFENFAKRTQSEEVPSEGTLEEMPTKGISDEVLSEGLAGKVPTERIHEEVPTETLPEELPKQLKYLKTQREETSPKAELAEVAPDAQRHIYTERKSKATCGWCPLPMCTSVSPTLEVPSKPQHEVVPVELPEESPPVESLMLPTKTKPDEMLSEAEQIELPTNEVFITKPQSEEVHREEKPKPEEEPSKVVPEEIPIRPYKALAAVELEKAFPKTKPEEVPDVREPRKMFLEMNAEEMFKKSTDEVPAELELEEVPTKERPKEALAEVGLEEQPVGEEPEQPPMEPQDEQMPEKQKYPKAHTKELHKKEELTEVPSDVQKLPQRKPSVTCGCFPIRRRSRPYFSEEIQPKTPTEEVSEEGETKVIHEEKLAKPQPEQIPSDDTEGKSPLELPLEVETEVPTKATKEALVEKEPKEIATKTHAEEQLIEGQPDQVLADRKFAQVQTEQEHYDMSPEVKPEELSVKIQPRVMPRAVEPVKKTTKPSHEERKELPTEIKYDEMTLEEEKKELLTEAKPDKMATQEKVQTKPKPDRMEENAQAKEQLTEIAPDHALAEQKFAQVQTQQEHYVMSPEVKPEELSVKIQPRVMPRAVEPVKKPTKPSHEERKELPTEIKYDEMTLEEEKKELLTEAKPDKMATQEKVQTKPKPDRMEEKTQAKEQVTEIAPDQVLAEQKFAQVQTEQEHYDMSPEVNPEELSVKIQPRVMPRAVEPVKKTTKPSQEERKELPTEIKYDEMTLEEEKKELLTEAKPDKMATQEKVQTKPKPDRMEENAQAKEQLTEIAPDHALAEQKFAQVQTQQEHYVMSPEVKPEELSVKIQPRVMPRAVEPVKKPTKPSHEERKELPTEIKYDEMTLEEEKKELLTEAKPDKMATQEKVQTKPKPDRMEEKTQAKEQVTEIAPDQVLAEQKFAQVQTEQEHYDMSPEVNPEELSVKIQPRVMPRAVEPVKKTTKPSQEEKKELPTEIKYDEMTLEEEKKELLTEAKPDKMATQEKVQTKPKPDRMEETTQAKEQLTERAPDQVLAEQKFAQVQTQQEHYDMSPEVKPEELSVKIQPEIMPKSAELVEKPTKPSREEGKDIHAETKTKEMMLDEEWKELPIESKSDRITSEQEKKELPTETKMDEMTLEKECKEIPKETKQIKITSQEVEVEEQLIEGQPDQVLAEPKFAQVQTKPKPDRMEEKTQPKEQLTERAPDQVLAEQKFAQVQTEQEHYDMSPEVKPEEVSVKIQTRVMPRAVEPVTKTTKPSQEERKELPTEIKYAEMTLEGEKKELLTEAKPDKMATQEKVQTKPKPDRVEEKTQAKEQLTERAPDQVLAEQKFAQVQTEQEHYDMSPEVKPEELSVKIQPEIMSKSAELVEKPTKPSREEEKDIHTETKTKEMMLEKEWKELPIESKSDRITFEQEKKELPTETKMDEMTLEKEWKEIPKETKQIKITSQEVEVQTDSELYQPEEQFTEQVRAEPNFAQVQTEHEHYDMSPEVTSEELPIKLLSEIMLRTAEPAQKPTKPSQEEEQEQATESRPDEKTLEEKWKQLPIETKPDEMTLEEKWKQLPIETKPDEMTLEEEWKQLPIETKPDEMTLEEEWKQLPIETKPDEKTLEEKWKQLPIETKPDEMTLEEEWKELPIETKPDEMTLEEEWKQLSLETKPDEMTLEEKWKELPIETKPDEMTLEEEQKELPTESKPNEMTSEEEKKELPTEAKPDEMTLEEEWKELHAEAKPDEMTLEEEGKELFTETKPDEMTLEEEGKELLTETKPDEMTLEEEGKELLTEAKPDEMTLEEEGKELLTETKPDEMTLEEEGKELFTETKPDEMTLEEEGKELLTEAKPDEMTLEEEGKELPTEAKPDEMTLEEEGKELFTETKPDEMTLEEEGKELLTEAKPDEMTSEEETKELPTEAKPDEMMLEEEGKELLTETKPDEMTSEEEKKELPTETKPDEITLEEEWKELATETKPDEMTLEEEGKELPTETKPDEVMLEEERKELFTEAKPDEMTLEEEKNELPTETQPDEMPSEDEWKELSTETQPDEMSTPAEAEELVATDAQPEKALTDVQTTELKGTEDSVVSLKRDSIIHVKERESFSNFGDDEGTDSDHDFFKSRPKLQRSTALRDVKRSSRDVREDDSSLDALEQGVLDTLPQKAAVFRPDELADSEDRYAKDTVPSQPRPEERVASTVPVIVTSEGSSSFQPLSKGKEDDLSADRILDEEVAEIIARPRLSRSVSPSRRPSPSYYCFECQVPLSKVRGNWMLGTFACEQCSAVIEIRTEGRQGVHWSEATETPFATQVIVVNGPIVRSSRQRTPVGRLDGGGRLLSSVLFYNKDV